MADFASIQSALISTMEGDDTTASTTTTQSAPPTVTVTDPQPTNDSTTGTGATVVAPAPASELESDDFEFSWEKGDDTKAETKGVEQTKTGDKGTPAPGQTPPVVADGQGVEEKIPNADENQIDWDALPPEKVEQAFLKTERGRRVLSTFKSMRELSKPVDEGGLGFIPSVDQIRSFHESNETMEAMEYDFGVGDTRHAAKFINHWWEVDQQGNPTKAGLVAADAIVNSIPDPYYMQIAQGMFTKYCEELVARAEKSTDEKDKSYAKTLAKALAEDLGLTAKVKGLANDPTVLDPTLKAEYEKLDRERADIESIRSTKTEEAKRAISSNIVTTRTTNLQSDLGEVLDSAISSLPNKSDIQKGLIYTSLLDSFKREVYSRIEKDTPGQERYRRSRDIALRTGNQQDIRNAVEQFRKISAPVVKSLAPKYRSALAQQVQSASATTHKALSEGASKVAPASVGQPTQQTIHQKLAKLPGESQSDYLQRSLEASMSL